MPSWMLENTQQDVTQDSDVSQFPGRCVRVSPGGGLHLPVWDPWKKDPGSPVNKTGAPRCSAATFRTM